MNDETEDQRDAAPTGEGERDPDKLKITRGKEFVEGFGVDILTLKDLRQEIGRELGMRRNLYPKWIAQKRIYPTPAAHQLRCMEALYGYLKDLEIIEKDHPQTKEACHDFTSASLLKALRTPIPTIP